MQQIRLNLPEISILYVRNLNVPLENQNIDFYIQEGVDGTYEIYQLSPNYFGYHSDFHNRLAYSFDSLSIENQIKFKNYCRNMVQNGNGTYYEKSKKYVYKKTEF